MYVVVGGTGAVGAQVVSLLHNQGSDVVILGRTPGVKTAEERASDNTVEGQFVHLDLEDRSSIREAARTILEFPDPIEGIAFASGIGHGSTIQLFKSDDADRVFRVNAIGPIDFARRLTKKISPGGSIVFLSSVASKYVQRGNGIYGASKIALERLAQNLSIELKDLDLRIHCLRPGAIQSEMFDSMAESSKIELIEKSQRGGPIPSDEVARLVTFLLGRDSQALSSARIDFDAGYW